MFQAIVRSSDGEIRTGLRPDDLAAILQEPGVLLWVNLAEEPPEHCTPILRDTFGFHPLAVDDALEEAHSPKIDDWGDYLYLVVHGIVFDEDNDDLLSTRELDVFLGRNYVVTHQKEPIAAVARVWQSCEREGRPLQKGAARLLYRIIDEMVTDFMPAVEKLDEAIDHVEDEVFNSPQSTLLERVFKLKRALLYLRRIISPQREVLNKLARDDFAVIALEERAFFRDIYDHYVRLYDIVDSLRDLVTSALETYLSVLNNKMNEVMKTLTTITVLFMPVSFIVGFFGINFFEPTANMYAWTSLPAFVLMMLVLIIVPAGMYYWMRSRAWM